MLNTIRIVTHYHKDDASFSSDYYDVEVFVNGVLAASFGDHYHEHGRILADGFLMGVNWANKWTEYNSQVVYEDVADRD